MLEKVLRTLYPTIKNIFFLSFLTSPGITFDSGGISIKPSSGMGEMKADMGGAACVAASTLAIATMGLPLKYV